MVGKSVGEAVGAVDGTDVGDKVGAAVGESVDSTDGAGVGARDGVADGAGVGDMVGRAAVGAEVGNAVKIASSEYSSSSSSATSTRSMRPCSTSSMHDATSQSATSAPNVPPATTPQSAAHPPATSSELDSKQSHTSSIRSPYGRFAVSYATTAAWTSQQQFPLHGQSTAAACNDAQISREVARRLSHTSDRGSTASA